MLAEAQRRVIPLAVTTAREINESWAVAQVQVAHLVLEMWTRQ